MRIILLLSGIALSLTGCGGGEKQGPSNVASADGGRAIAQDSANRAMAQTRQDALEKRVTALEHDVDRLSAEVETPLGLDAAQRASGGSIAGASSPLVPPSPPLPAITPPQTPPAAAKDAQN